MYEQEKSKTSETALLTALALKRLPGGAAFKFGHCASTSVRVAQLEGGQRQAPSEIRGLGNVAPEESL